MRPLTETERKVVILFKLYQKEHRQGAPWGWVRRQAGIGRGQMQATMYDLRKLRAVHYSTHPGQTFATDRGVQAALNGK